MAKDVIDPAIIISQYLVMDDQIRSEAPIRRLSLCNFASSG